MAEEHAVSFMPFFHRTVPSVVTDPPDVAQFFRAHFGRDHAILTVNGRQAIAIALERLGLKRSDEVLIVTTFDYPNVSSCVTCTVFNYCKPSRVMSRATRAVIVIHEFGVPYDHMPELAEECRRRRLPLIEDCAHTIDSARNGYRVGTLGDWVVCSFSKIFPVLAGGVLLGPAVNYPMSPRHRAQIKETARQAGMYLREFPVSSARRREIYRQLTRHALRVGLSPIFEVTDTTTPWFFPLPVPDPAYIMGIAAQAGVECGLWHGTDIIVFPCHQYLNERDIAQISAVIERSMEGC